MVGERPAGLGRRLGVDQRLHDELGVGGPLEVERLPYHVGHSGAVGEDVADRDRALAVAVIAGDVGGHRVGDVEHAALVQPVHERGRDRLGARVDEHRRVRGGADRLGAVGLARPVAAGVADRAVEHDRSAVAHADLQRGVHAAAIHAEGAPPDALHRVGAQRPGVVLGAPRRDGVQVVGHANPAQWIRETRNVRQGGDSHGALHPKGNAPPSRIWSSCPSRLATDHGRL